MNFETETVRGFTVEKRWKEDWAKKDIEDIQRDIKRMRDENKEEKRDQLLMTKKMDMMIGKMDEMMGGIKEMSNKSSFPEMTKSYLGIQKTDKKGEKEEDEKGCPPGLSFGEGVQGRIMMEGQVKKWLEIKVMGLSKSKAT